MSTIAQARARFFIMFILNRSAAVPTAITRMIAVVI